MRLLGIRIGVCVVNILHLLLLAGKVTTDEELEDMLESGNPAIFTSDVRPLSHSQNTCKQSNPTESLCTITFLFKEVSCTALWRTVKYYTDRLRLAKGNDCFCILTQSYGTSVSLTFPRRSSRTPRSPGRPWTRSSRGTRTLSAWSPASRSFMTCLWIWPCWWRPRCLHSALQHTWRDTVLSENNTPPMESML